VAKAILLDSVEFAMLQELARNLSNGLRTVEIVI